MFPTSTSPALQCSNRYVFLPEARFDRIHSSCIDQSSSQSWSNFWDDTEDERYRALDINLSHVLKLTRIAIRAVLGRDKPGVVLMISSIGGLRSSYAPVMYCTAKHALVGFTKGMAVADDAEGVKVVCICPG